MASMYSTPQKVKLFLVVLSPLERGLSILIITKKAFVRHAYFLGKDDPCKQLKNALKAEIDEEAWESLYSNVSRSFPKRSGRIAVKVINHLGDGDESIQNRLRL